MPLTDTKCRNAKPTDHPYRLLDGKGLHLEIRPTGAKLWRYRYRISGKENLFAVGDYPEFSLERARAERAKARELVKRGIHPSHDRRAQKLGQIAANASTFEAVAREWYETKRIGWTPGRAAQIERILASDVFPYIGRLPIASIRAQEMISVVDRIVKRQAPSIARIAWNASCKVFAVAKKKGRLDASPISDIEDVVPRVPTKHRAPLTRKDIPGIVGAIKGYAGERQTVIALRLLMLTFVRGAELRGAEWTEFDLDHAEWRIPASRMKMRETHIVPLSTQAVDLLRELHEITGARRYLFPNQQRPRAYMAPSTMHAALCTLGYRGKFSPHGFRATASTMLNEVGFRPDIIERQLAHKEGNSVRASYNQAQYLDERRRMMQTWADLVDEYAKADSKVVAGKFKRVA